ncbi:PSD1 and planctomycete cytochrome C domain-containing protein [Roseimaritima ulvae]|nr:PSD1 and planctomycete cytochrome C domain-containing protein [Roseimaritima ulvae]
MAVRGLLASLLVLAAGVSSRAADPAIDFNQDVRPILSNHCFACHGPDEEKRDSGLRLDTQDGLFEVVTAGSLEDSELIARVLSEDEDTVMPPPRMHKPLSDAQQETLRQWVLQGAPYAAHWSFVPPQRPAPTDIDAFINQRLAAAGLQANGPEDPRRLFRRLSFDLTGLPPTVEETERFAADPSDEAYEQAVDRMLASPRYGEHMARFWLDLVRYGDTHGLHLDNYREMWPYRDWVIRAFNDNKPFDQFSIEQLAGDLLPDPTQDQMIASGFNRLNVTTSEGGSIYDEVFFRNVVDRVDAFGTIFLGLTTQCSTCHDHKFDPITQQDYYSLYAFFNSLDGRALDGNAKDHPPNIRVPQPENEQQLAEIDRLLAALDVEARQPIDTVDAEQTRWEQSLTEGGEVRWHTLQPDQYSLDEGSPLTLAKLEDGSLQATGKPAAKDNLTIEAPLPDQAGLRLLRLEVLTAGPKVPAGLSPNGNAVLTEIEVETKSPATGDQWLPIKLAYGEADYEQPDGKFALTYAFDGKEVGNEGWAIGGHLHPGPRTAWFASRGLLSEGQDARLRVRLKFQSQYAGHQFGHVRFSVSDQIPQAAEDKQLQQSPWHLAGPFPVESAKPGYDRNIGSLKGALDAAKPIRYDDQDYAWTVQDEFGDAVPNDLPVTADQPSVVLLHRTLTAPTAQKATLLLGTDDGVQVWLNGKKVGETQQARPLIPLQDEYQLDLVAGENQLYLKVVNHSGDSSFSYAIRSPAAIVPAAVRALAALPAERRSEPQAAALQTYYRQAVCLHPDWLALKDERAGLLKQRETVRNQAPITLVWKETKQPRQAHIMLRGQYDQPGDKVTRRVPEFLPPLADDAPVDRLGLARWLFAPDHPLTARVAVNRFWQQVFGTGIVKTSEDFGSQGDQPSHPELLDFLAIDYRENNWDVKRLMKQLVMSDAYRRDTTATAEMLAADPTNRLLARGPRFRLDAEMLRDQALDVGGLLVEKVGGPSVKPPQPDGLWFAVGYSGSNTVRFKADSGDKIYRRSVYTFWKRTSAPPQMSTFDAPSRESCTARRERTNTPLQALLLLNEQQYVTAAKRLAADALGTEAADEQRMHELFQQVTFRPPSDVELKELQGLLADMQTLYEQNSEAAKQLVDKPEPALAAWTIIANTLLNLDEVVSK